MVISLVRDYMAQIVSDKLNGAKMNIHKVITKKWLFNWNSYWFSNLMSCQIHKYYELVSV